MATKLNSFTFRILICVCVIGTAMRAQALCTSIVEKDLPEAEPVLSKVAYYIAGHENNYRMIRFISAGAHFNIQYCHQLGRNFSVENYNEFEPEFCETISDMWISYSEAEIFHKHFIRYLQTHLQEQEFNDVKHTFIHEVLARVDDVGTGILGGLILKFVKAHPWSSGRFNALASRATRAAGGFLLFSAFLGILADQAELEKTNASVRALELKALLSDHEHRNQYLIGPNAKDRAVNRIMEILKESLSKALYDTYAEKCIA